MSSQYIIGIGAQKAGTTWLSDYLDKHTDICFSPRKEMHYFDAKYLPELCGQWDQQFQKELASPAFRKRLKWVLATGLIGKHAISYTEFLRLRIQMASDEQAYVRFFDKLNRGQKYNAEVTPSYSMLGVEGFAAMKRLLTNVKVIFIMRNPADRFWSNMRHIQGQNQAFDPKREFEQRLSDPQNILRTDYKRTLESLDQVFHRDEVLYLFYEKLFHESDNGVYLQRLHEFLDIPAGKANFEKTLNKSVRNELQADIRDKIVGRFAYVYEYIANRFGDIPDSWHVDMKTSAYEEGLTVSQN